MIYRNIYIVTFIVVIFTITIIGFRYLSRPVYGRAFQSKVSLSNNKPVIKKAIVDQSFQTSYYNLAIPSGFMVQANSAKPINNLLESTTLINSDPNSPMIIQIGIYNDAGIISSNSPYMIRINNPNQYINQKIGSVDLTYSNTSDGVVCFWQHGNYLATLSVTTGLQQTANDFLQNEILVAKNLIYNWQWK